MDITTPTKYSKNVEKIQKKIDIFLKNSNVKKIPKISQKNYEEYYAAALKFNKSFDGNLYYKGLKIEKI